MRCFILAIFCQFDYATLNFALGLCQQPNYNMVHTDDIGLKLLLKK